MKTQSKPLDPRCRDIRHRLPDFLHEKLGVIATGEVQGHLLSCQSCSEVYAELLMHEVESGTEPLRTPPTIPPIDWYDAYLQHPNRFGVMWDSLRNALQSADETVSQWAKEQMERISNALSQLLTSPQPAPAHERTRGAVRTRGGTSTQTPVTLQADILSSAWEPTGETVSFIVEESPHITPDGHFRLRLRTQTTEYHGYPVICSVDLPDMLPISFRGMLRRGEVEIDKEGILCGEGNIRGEQVKLVVVKL